MRTLLFRVVFVLYVAFLVACGWTFATDNGGGGPYQIGKALAAIGAGLPWTLAVFVLYPPHAGPWLLYVLSVAGALVNLALLARFAGWLPGRRAN
jgi:hypothetical protein